MTSIFSEDTQMDVEVLSPSSTYPVLTTTAPELQLDPQYQFPPIAYLTPENSLTGAMFSAAMLCTPTANQLSTPTTTGPTSRYNLRQRGKRSPPPVISSPHKKTKSRLHGPSATSSKASITRPSLPTSVPHTHQHHQHHQNRNQSLPRFVPPPFVIPSPATTTPATALATITATPSSCGTPIPMMLNNNIYNSNGSASGTYDLSQSPTTCSLPWAVRAMKLGDSTTTPSPVRMPFERTQSLNSEDCGATGGSSWSFYYSEFIEQRDLGNGCFGRVTKVQKRTDGMVYAVKRSWTQIKGELDKEYRAREIRALARCEHPNIVRYFSSWYENGFSFLQMEFCPGGTILSAPPEFWNRTHAIQLLSDIGSALAYLHGNHMAHLDVKGENIYISARNTFKLGDFGLVAFLDGHTAANLNSQSSPLACPSAQPTSTSALFNIERTHSCVSSLSFTQDTQESSASSPDEGDKRYLSPEILNDKSNLRAADMFALGIASYEVFSHRPLPGGGEEWHRFRQPGNHQFIEPIAGLDADIFDLLLRLMEWDPIQRLTAPNLLDMVKELPSANGA